MGVKKTFAIAAAAALLSTTALAQTQTPPARDTAPAMPRAAEPMPAPGDSMAALPLSSLRVIKSDTAMAPGLNVNAKELDGMDIYGSDGKKIGEVDKVLGDSTNTIKAVTVDVGGFLGIGAKEVVVPLDRLRKGSEKDRLNTTMTRADFEKLAKWEDPDRNMRGEPASRPAAPGTGTTR